MVVEKEVLKYLKLYKGVHRKGYNTNMKKSGKTNIFEPTDTSWENDFPECATLFKRAGWFSFFERITVSIHRSRIVSPRVSLRILLLLILLSLN